MTRGAVGSALCATLLAGNLALSASTARADCASLPGDDGVADLHVDLPFHVAYRDRPAELDEDGSQVTASSLRAGCVRLLVLSLYVPSGLRPREHDLGQLEALLEVADGIVADNPQLHDGNGDDGVRVVYATEGSDALAGHLDRIPELVDRGVRMFGLVHAWHNRLADSATDPRPGRGGLTDEGARFVRAVYRAGGLVDVSHASDAAFDDVARIARAMDRPLVASHSNARALADHDRNLSDAQLRTVAETGGVVGLAFHRPFLKAGDGPVTADDVARHAAHMIAVMGPEHVAIGSDIDGLIRPAEGLGTHAGLPKLVPVLCRRGIRGERLEALLHDNAARLFDQ